MKKTVLTIIAFFLVAITIVFCGKINIIELNATKPISNPTVEVADESLPLSVAEEENDEILEEKEDTETQKTEKNQKTSDVINSNHTETLSNTTEEETTNESVLNCTLSITCHSVFENIEKLNEEKKSVLPQNGIVFPETEVIYYEGESAFNILSRELKKNKIHIDFVNTPMYNTVYIKGISNLYEKDCGELSGWLYMVNGEIPGYGCSQYLLKPGDKIEFIYTCNSGKDVTR